MSDPSLRPYERFVAFFDQAALGQYLQQPDLYLIETDHFEGHLKTHGPAPAADEVDVRFGYRTRADGSLGIAAFRPDIDKLSQAHIARWASFIIEEPAWPTPDERYELWLRRYLAGDWSVDNGTRAQLEDLVRRVRALTNEMTDVLLFKVPSIEALKFPMAQNTHSYEDAHVPLYGYLIDGLEKEAIVRIGKKGGVTFDASSYRAVNALRKAVPMLPDTSPLWAAFEVTSKHRAAATHGTRPTAVRFGAFEQFKADLDQWVAGLRDLLSCLETLLGMKGAAAEKRQATKQFLPKIDRPSDPHYSIAQLPRAIRKTIERVEYGFTADRRSSHRGEGLILHFSDGSILGIGIGSNVQRLSDDFQGLAPSDLHVDFSLQWVPSPSEAEDSEP